MEPEVNKADGKPIKPNFKTVEINLISVMYSKSGFLSLSLYNLMQHDSYTYRVTLPTAK